MKQRPPSSAAEAVESRLMRALAILRLVLLANTLTLASVHHADFRHGGAAVAAFAVMTGWTGLTWWAYRAPSRRTRLLLASDLGVTLALLLLSPLVKGHDFTASLPGFWIIGALLACAVHYRTAGGLAAGLLLAAVDVLQREHLSQTDYGDAFLLVISGATVGYLAGSLQLMATERDAAERRAAAAAERARLARVVHDGVLQVLALVQRYGAEHAHDADGIAAALGEQAGRQERELRGLIRTSDTLAAGRSAYLAAGRSAYLADGGADGRADGRTADLVALLNRLEQRWVTVATPAYPVALPAATAQELIAAVEACLHNVRRHVGEEAPAYVLLQALPGHVEVCVRDDGPGIPPGRLEEARDQGRLGISESICGRLAAIGGTARLSTGHLGTEWELTVPCDRSGASDRGGRR